MTTNDIPTEAQEQVALHRFVIPYRLPSYNEASNADRSHAQKGARLRREIEQGIMWEIKAAHVKPVLSPCIVVMTFVEGNRKRDVDNVESAKKYILDALVSSGILQGDSPKWVVGVPSFTVYENGAKVLVTIVESADKNRLAASLYEAAEIFKWYQAQPDRTKGE
jgi:hypothetical protein